MRFHQMRKPFSFAAFSWYFRWCNTGWVFPRIGVPQNGWFIMENPIKMENLGVLLFLETPRCKFHQKDAMLTARGALVLASVLALDHPLSLMGLCLLSLGCRVKQFEGNH